MTDSQACVAWLWLLTALFLARVLGQVIVVLWAPRWLPPMAQWYSGLMAYRYLLPCQIAILVLQTALNESCRRAVWVFAEPRPRAASVLVALALVYWAGMVVRYVARMIRKREERWFGGTIPIVFHCVLAGYLFVLGRCLAGPLAR